MTDYSLLEMLRVSCFSGSILVSSIIFSSYPFRQRISSKVWSGFSSVVWVGHLCCTHLCSLRTKFILQFLARTE